MKRGQFGFTVIELLVVIGIIGVVFAVAIPNLNSGQLDLSTASQELESEIRLARAYSISRGAHFRITISGSSYTVERLQDLDGDGIWESDGRYPSRTTNLPSSVTVTTGAGAIIEFNTRGLRVFDADGTPADKVNVVLHDAVREGAKTLEIWPSGQVLEI